MISRLNMIGESRHRIIEREPSTARRGHSSGWLILIGVSAIYILWIVYHWLGQPAWPDELPSFFNELLDLLEMATALTLVLIWMGIFWRKYGRSKASRPQPLNREELYELNPKSFEHYIAGLFRQKGYEVIVRGQSGDHGVDLELISSNKKRAIVQCKRYRDTVGEEIVRDLFGTLLHERASRAFLVTTADISDAARRWAAGKPITLIDGKLLVDIIVSLAEVREK